MTICRVLGVFINLKISLKFRLKIPLETLELKLTKSIYTANCDEDGDLIKVSSILVPFYGGAQTVENVGLQTWRASLLLAEYIYTHINDFRDTNVLELGAGKFRRICLSLQGITVKILVENRRGGPLF